MCVNRWRLAAQFPTVLSSASVLQWHPAKDGTLCLFRNLGYVLVAWTLCEQAGRRRGGRGVALEGAIAMYIRGKQGSEVSIHNLS